MRKIVFCLIAAAMALTSLPVAAQRQTAGRHSIEGAMFFGEDLPDWRIAGGNLSWSNYNYFGRVVYGVDFLVSPMTHHVDAQYVTAKVGDTDVTSEVSPAADYDLWCRDLVATGGYMFRLLAPRNRVVVLSAGASLGVGVRMSKELTGYTYQTDNYGSEENYKGVGFLLQAYPEVQLEGFFLNNMSVFAIVKPRMSIVSGLKVNPRWFYMSYGFGLKYYL